MNIIELSKIMALCQRAIKTLSYKPDGNAFVQVGASKMRGEGAIVVLYGKSL